MNSDVMGLVGKWRRQAAENYNDRGNALERCASDLEVALNAQAPVDAALQARVARLEEALRNLLMGAGNIRGIDLEDYCPNEVELARAAIAASTKGPEGLS